MAFRCLILLGCLFLGAGCASTSTHPNPKREPSSVNANERIFKILTEVGVTKDKKGTFELVDIRCTGTTWNMGRAYVQTCVARDPRADTMIDLNIDRSKNEYPPARALMDAIGMSGIRMNDIMTSTSEQLGGEWQFFIPSLACSTVQNKVSTCRITLELPIGLVD